MLRSTFTCVILAFAVIASMGQAPSKLSFQGYLTTPAGVPINGTHSVEFKIYRDSSEVWSETQSVTVDSGIFNVILGQVTRLDKVAFDAPLDLGVIVGTDPEISPRTPLGSAAYAQALPGLYTFYREGSVAKSFNVIGGSPLNVVGSDVAGATIGGGGGIYTSISRPNEVHDHYATVGGGVKNRANGSASTISGGFENLAEGHSATIGGGADNWVNGLWATIPGGVGNEATADKTFAAGHYAKARHEGTFVWSDASSGEFASTGQNQFLIGAAGGVGIGTANPIGQLHISGGAGDARIRLEADTNNTDEFANPIIELRQDGNIVGFNIGLDQLNFGDSTFGIGRRLGSTDHFDTFVIQGFDGDVGIGTNDPGSNRLYVTSGSGVGLDGATVRSVNTSTSNGIAGFFESNGTDATAVFTNHGSGDVLRGFSPGELVFQVKNNGDVLADGTFTSPAMDLAEVFAVEGSALEYEPGDLLEISTKHERVVTKSTRPYSTRVAGVYATKPGVRLGTPIEGRTVPMGVIGVLPTKVSAENGPIRPGDILVSSSTPGHAMKAESTLINGIEIYPSGSMLGKALEPFEGPGTGMIEVLVNTQ